MNVNKTLNKSVLSIIQLLTAFPYTRPFVQHGAIIIQFVFISDRYSAVEYPYINTWWCPSSSSMLSSSS